jgi:hypothetical protein
MDRARRRVRASSRRLQSCLSSAEDSRSWPGWSPWLAELPRGVGGTLVVWGIIAILVGVVEIWAGTGALNLREQVRMERLLWSASTRS